MSDRSQWLKKQEDKSEIIDLAFACGERLDMNDPVCHAMLNLLSNGPTGNLVTDFGPIKPYHVELKINGETVFFSALVEQIYSDWQHAVSTAAERRIDEFAREAMSELEDEIHDLRGAIRDRVDTLNRKVT